MVGQISVLRPRDTACFDEETLNGLCRDLGPNIAENILCRALEDMAARLIRIREDYGCGDRDALRKTVHALVPIADQIGLPKLAQIGRDVLNCADRTDQVALAATLFRFLRYGEMAIASAETGMDRTL